MKSDSDRGVIGAWARNARIAAGHESAQEAVRAMAAVGLTVDLGYLRGIESGAHRPSKALMERLAAFYRAPLPEEDETFTFTRSDLERMLQEAARRGALLALEEAEDRDE